MVYMGSKKRIARDLKNIMLIGRKDEQWYVEPFAGGMNMICHVSGKRIANDIHTPLIEMWKMLVENNWKPDYIEKELYEHIKLNREKYPNYIVGYAGFVCSFRGKYFDCFSNKYKCKGNNERDDQINHINNIYKQVSLLKGVIFKNADYKDLDISNNSIVYCDPPYIGTREYKNTKKINFDHVEFWNWVREKSKYNNVYVSEYTAPSDFVCVWKKELVSTLAYNTKTKTNNTKISIEKLFIHESKINKKKFFSLL